MRGHILPARLGSLGLILVMTLGVAATAVAADRHEELATRLSGAEEVPPADADGTGRATLDLRHEIGEVCWSVEFNRIGTPHAGHIHREAAGVNGPVVVPLFTPMDAADPVHDELERGRASGCVTADSALVAEIADNPTAFYVNLHNARFPGGAIRGQLGD